MKGISPLVAAVLLIAVTMTIAGILAYWTSSYVRTSLPAENETAKLQRCIAANFALYFSSYNSSTRNMTIILENKADVQLTITNITFVYANGTLNTQKVDTTLPKGGVLVSLRLSDVDSGYSNYEIYSDCPNAKVSGK